MSPLLYPLSYEPVLFDDTTEAARFEEKRRRISIAACFTDLPDFLAR
jgi:hypothetical protein